MNSLEFILFFLPIAFMFGFIVAAGLQASKTVMIVLFFSILNSFLILVAYTSLAKVIC